MASIPADTECGVCSSNMGVPAYQPAAAGVDSDGSADEDTQVVAVAGRKATYTLRCGHTYHTSCILKVLRRKPQCPSCSMRVDNEPVWPAAQPPMPDIRLDIRPDRHDRHDRRWGARNFDDSDDDNSNSGDDAEDFDTTMFVTDLERHAVRARHMERLAGGMAQGQGQGQARDEAEPDTANRTVRTITVQNRDGTFATRGTITVYAPGAAAPPDAVPAVPRPPMPTAPTITRVYDSTTVRELPQLNDTANWVVDLVLPLSASFRRAVHAPMPATRNVKLCVLPTVHDVFQARVPPACHVELSNEQHQDVQFFVSALAHYPYGDPYNANCTWYYSCDEGWRLATDKLLHPNTEYRFLLTWHPTTPHVGIRAFCPYDDGDAMLADVRARLPPQDAVDAGAAMDAAIVATPAPAAGDAGFTPSIAEPDAAGCVFMQVLPTLRVASPRVGEHSAPAIRKHIERQHTPWAAVYAATDGTDVAFMRQGTDLSIAVTRHTRNGPQRDEYTAVWTPTMQNLLLALVSQGVVAAAPPVPPVAVAAVAPLPADGANDVRVRARLRAEAAARRAAQVPTE